MLELKMDAFDTFECIGSACEDTCCRDWNITIDQGTYFKYKKETNPEFKETFEKGTIRLRNANKEAYALMAFNKNGECMFLDENRLCSVYKMLGPDKMCDTCKVYPRYSIDVYGVIQRGVFISCPEACRKVLFRENPIEFNLEDTNSNYPLLTKKIPVENYDCFSQEIYFALQSFSIGVLQNRNYPLEERLLVLGMFLEDINGKSEDEIFNTIDKYSLNLDKGLFRGIATHIDKKDTLDNEIKNCINIYLSILPYFKQGKVRSTMINIEEGLNLSNYNNLNDFKTHYLSIKNNYGNDIFNTYHYVLENYLVNYIFKKPAMFLTKNLMFNYAEMLLYYNMVRFSMIGTIGCLKEEVKENDLVLTISTIARAVEHSEEVRTSLKSLVTKLGLNNLSNILPLIIN